MSILFQKRLNEVRGALDKIEAAEAAVRALAEGEPQEFPTRPRIVGLRTISRSLGAQAEALSRLYE